MAQYPVSAEGQTLLLLVDVSADPAPSTDGQPIDSQLASSSVSIWNPTASQVVDYLAPGGIWTPLKWQTRVVLDVNLATQTVRLRRGLPAANPTRVEVTIEGLPTGLIAAVQQEGDVTVGGEISTGSLPFATSVALTGSGEMPLQSVSGVLAFTPNLSSAQSGATVTVDLIADGSHVPTFVGFSEWDGSSGYYNTAGVRNCVTFFWRGGKPFYSINQIAGHPVETTTPPPPPPPPPPPAANPRLSSKTNVAESGDGTAGWVYTIATSGTPAPIAGFSQLKMAAGATASCAGKIAAFDGNTFVMLGLRTVNLGAQYQDFAFAIFVGGDGNYSVVTAGTVTTINGNALSFQANDIMRLRRVGTTLYAEVSHDSGSTFTVLHTWTGAAADLFPVIQLGVGGGNANQSTIGPLIGAGMVAV